MDRKGQGTFEYILLLAGILLIVVLAIVLLRGGIFQTSQSNIQRDSCRSALVQSSSCYTATGGWNPAGNITIPTTGHVCSAFARVLTTPPCTAASQFGDAFNNPAGTGNQIDFCCAQQPS